MKKIFLTIMAVVICAVTANAQCVYPTDTVKIKFKIKPQGVLEGDFAINNTGGKVRFAQGNLMYTRAHNADWSTGTFSFMNNQYDMVETNGSIGSSEYADKDTISLFGWATSGNPASGTRYQPWETYNTGDNYIGYGPTGIDNQEWVAANSDWGQNMGSGWRTLTQAEWFYIITGSRTGSTVNGGARKRYAKATVNGVAGVILFPDGGTFLSSEFSKLGSLDSYSAEYNATTCTSSQWDALEAKGCVFLPAAGYRDGTTVGDVGVWTRYWTSSANKNEYWATGSTASSGFISNSYHGAQITKRSMGCAVRLVVDVE